MMINKGPPGQERLKMCRDLTIVEDSSNILQEPTKLIRI